MKNQLVIHDSFSLNQSDFSLLETMLWQAHDGYFVLDYHLQRLKNSAIYFDFSVDINSLKTQLNKLAESFLMSKLQQ